MLDRIFGFFNPSSASSSTAAVGKSSAEPELRVECFECRMVGGGGLTALGGYIIYYAFQKRNQPATGRATMFASSFLGSVIMTLGLLRLAGLHELESASTTTTAAAKVQKPPKVTGEKKDAELLKD
ncbi:hypothetical protein TYRP_011324 [Tyrophagus putrescentiae]|nr:hypothetical protein TYRP_011324 [Tyrophagus putrescentiae]